MVYISFNGVFCEVVVQESCFVKMVQTKSAKLFFYPVMKLMVQVSRKGTSENHR